MLETTHLILLNMTKYQSQILHFLEIQTLDVMFYPCGKFIALIKTEALKYQV